MCDWKHTLIAKDTSIKFALQVIDSSCCQIALVVDKDNRLLGTVTDGDIRRGLLRNLTLDDPVMEVANINPISVSADDDMDQVRQRMRQDYLRQVPVLDEWGRVVRLELLRKHLQGGTRTTPVVIMAGGLGTRLRPLTYNCPKPMLPVAGRPLLEILLESFIRQDFRNFHISVNYKAEHIISYFGDGSRLGINISYLRESEPLGTAGALSLLPRMHEPTIIINGDLLTKVNFKLLLDFHKDEQAPATICVSENVINIPYGVVEVDDSKLRDIKEKPTKKYFINAGIYVLEPDTMAMIPKNRRYDMTMLFDELVRKRAWPSVFPIREYWLDIGQMHDFERANGEYCSFFDYDAAILPEDMPRDLN